ncbi:MAG: hypothetical protein EZS28_048435 [Streblomastix strix]|uniref:Uncharacterized protein n=1 Tax=Streblomastix strix TaxID=222440 RepID=A0A5J4TD23_9EUKA|nr:MAG: hypothetical protein EZS28_048435 [Streblomastix strix]
MTTQNELSEVVADCAETTNNPPMFPASQQDIEPSYLNALDYLTEDNNIQMEIDLQGNRQACPEDVNEDQKQAKTCSRPNVAFQSLSLKK